MKVKDVQKCIEHLRQQLEPHRRTGLKEYPTRTIFIDPLLGALCWDVRVTPLLTEPQESGA